MSFSMENTQIFPKIDRYTMGSSTVVLEHYPVCHLLIFVNTKTLKLSDSQRAIVLTNACIIYKFYRFFDL